MKSGMNESESKEPGSCVKTVYEIYAKKLDNSRFFMMWPNYRVIS